MKKTDKNIECFHAPAKSFKKDFDFESNLALFDKKAVFQEIEHRVHNLCLELDPRDRKYRHDENVLQPVEDNSTFVLTKQYSEIPDSNFQLYFTGNLSYIFVTYCYCRPKIFLYLYHVVLVIMPLRSLISCVLLIILQMISGY